LPAPSGVTRSWKHRSATIDRVAPAGPAARAAPLQQDPAKTRGATTRTCRIPVALTIGWSET